MKQTIKLYNTPDERLEDFKPQSDTVKIYTCGPTVYNYLHVGNWSAYIYWDTLIRLLHEVGYKTNRVMNITDVGHLTSDADSGADKLQQSAKIEKKTAWQLADYYIADFKAGLSELNIIMPDHLPRATDYIDKDWELIRVLKTKGYTYQIDDGIYFDTAKFPTYANFAHLNLENQKAGARVKYNDQKRNPSDFALWKFSQPNEKRDMEWATPKDLLSEGPATNHDVMGFPGWHIECSAMALNLLGPTLDIHTGGIDHIPVHHTNEIAQSESATGKKFSNCWLHCNYLTVDGEKISKSLNNGYTLKDIKDRGFSPLDFRLFVLQKHYRTQGNFDFSLLEAAYNRRQNWLKIAELRHQINETIDNDLPDNFSILAAKQAIIEKLCEDLNTPEALKVVDDIFNRIDIYTMNKIRKSDLVDLLELIDNLFGLKLIDSTPDISDDLKKLIIERQRARDDRDWQKSDDIRQLLSQNNIAVDDTPTGPVWHYLIK